ncbi:MAG TPA: CxxxxCH/CxxCH domain-containing protein [Anaeromyxobacter sp.]
MRGTLRAVAAALFAAGCGQPQTVSSPVGSASSCAGCHTAPGEGPPFRDQTGATDPHRLTVGAHDAHLHGNLSSNVTCGDCHTVPRRVTDPGHMDTVPPATVKFGGLALNGGADPRYVNQGCAATYCHGNFFGGNRTNTPAWLGDASAAACTACHGLPPSTGRHEKHVLDEGISCDQCHGPLFPATHVNGKVDVALAVWDPKYKTCQAMKCHGARSWPGPDDAGK